MAPFYNYYLIDLEGIKYNRDISSSRLGLEGDKKSRPQIATLCLSM